MQRHRQADLPQDLDGGTYIRVGGFGGDGFDGIDDGFKPYGYTVGNVWIVGLDG